nr:glycosyltransferase family 4 protein [Acinetobacter sp. Marseille-Q1620]
MRKICFFISTISNTGGTERVSTLIANELLNKGFDVCFFNLIGNANTQFELNANIKIYTLSLKEGSIKQNYFSTVWKLRNFVKNNQIDVVIDVDSILSVISVPALIGLSVQHICWEHFNFKVNLGVKFRSLGRILAAKFADNVVTLTQKDKKLWESNIKRINAKIVTIHNPSSYEQPKVNLDKLNYKIVLSVGRLTYQKGFDDLIDVWANICEYNPDWTLRIVGSGEDEECLKKQAKELNISDKIDFVPATKNIDKYYETSAFYCMSSRFEGLPMVLIEAQAFGLPIVSFDCDCGPSDIVDNGVNGFLVKNRSLNDLEKSLIKMMNLSSIEYNMFVENSILKNKKFLLEDSIIFEWIKLIDEYKCLSN